ncbi:ABC transporter permease, partial [bacterium]|nr:ABC transporter permease [bacterium]
MLLGTLIVSSAAKTAFLSAQKIVGGQVVANITPASGAQTMSEKIYVELRRKGITHAIPRVEGVLRLANGAFLSIQGVDAFSQMQWSARSSSKFFPSEASTFDQRLGITGKQDVPSQLDIITFSFPPYRSLISEAYAKVLGVNEGDTLLLDDGRQLPRIKIVPDDFGTGYSLLCDLRYAQDLLSLPVELTSIVLTEIGLGDTTQIKALLPKGTALWFPQKSAENRALNDAFFLNLTAVAFLAFLVGCFIAFNAVRFSVLQRLIIVRQLRLCGVTVREVSLSLILELLFWALLASVTGCLLGWLLAGFLVPNVGLTLSQIFGSKSVLNVAAVENWWFMALAISLIATATATVRPFWQLAHHKALQSEPLAKSNVSLNYIAVFLLLMGGLLTLLPQSQKLGFLVSTCWILGAVLLIPGGLMLFYSWISRFKRLIHFPKLHWAIQDGKFSHVRVSAAMMAFTMAIAAGIAITTMVGSFRYAFERFLEKTLSEDLLLRPSSTDFEEVEIFLDSHSDVAYLSSLYVHRAFIGQQMCRVFGLANNVHLQNSVSLEKEVSQLWQKIHNRQGVLINQTLAMQKGFELGDVFKTSINKKALEVEVLGVYLNYGDPRATFVMDQQWLLQLRPDLQSRGMGVYMQVGKSVDELLTSLKSRFNLMSHQYARPQEIKLLALKTFNQTFQA